MNPIPPVFSTKSQDPTQAQPKLEANNPIVSANPRNPNPPPNPDPPSSLSFTLLTPPGIMLVRISNK
jgi:hypothetical protein